MSLIYSTNEWNGYGKQNYYHNEYRREGDVVSKFKCNRFKSFDGKENSWHKDERLVDSWSVGDAALPEWLRKFL